MGQGHYIYYYIDEHENMSAGKYMHVVVYHDCYQRV